MNRWWNVCSLPVRTVLTRGHIIQFFTIFPMNLSNTSSTKIANSNNRPIINQYGWPIHIFRRKINHSSHLRIIIILLFLFIKQMDSKQLSFHSAFEFCITKVSFICIIRQFFFVHSFCAVNGLKCNEFSLSPCVIKCGIKARYILPLAYGIERNRHSRCICIQSVSQPFETKESLGKCWLSS